MYKIQLHDILFTDNEQSTTFSISQRKQSKGKIAHIIFFPINIVRCTVETERRWSFFVLVFMYELYINYI